MGVALKRVTQRRLDLPVIRGGREITPKVAVSNRRSTSKGLDRPAALGDENDVAFSRTVAKRRRSPPTASVASWPADKHYQWIRKSRLCPGGHNDDVQRYLAPLARFPVLESFTGTAQVRQ
jgi:hypothetical protein